MFDPSFTFDSRVCPSTTVHADFTFSFYPIGVQCKFAPGHAGSHCGIVTYNTNGVSWNSKDIWWENAEAPMTVEQALRQWHNVMGEDDDMELRQRLMAEEVQEFYDAIEADDKVELADAIADIVYIAVGTAVCLKMPFDKIFAEVHRSNMTKLDPVTRQPIKRDDGKILKPPHFEPPRIAEILRDND